MRFENGSVWSIVFMVFCGLLVLLQVILLGGFIAVIVQDIYHKHGKIHFNKRSWKQEAKNCGNPFLTNDFTIERALGFCKFLCEEVYKQREKRTIAIISVKKEIMYGDKSWGQYAKPETTEDIIRFESALGELVEVIMNTSSAKKLMGLKDFKLTISEPYYVDYHPYAGHHCYVIDINFEASNPNYKKPPQAKKWY